MGTRMRTGAASAPDFFFQVALVVEALTAGPHHALHTRAHAHAQAVVGLPRVADKADQHTSHV